MANEVRRQCKNNEVNIIMEDLNAKVEERRQGRVLWAHLVWEKYMKEEKDWLSGALPRTKYL